MSERAVTAIPFHYEKPPMERKKHVTVLARTDLMLAMVQIVKEGGENNLHSHPHTDGIWIVLRGRARFYGDNDELLGDFGPLEGIVIPRGTNYWYEKAGEDDLEILATQAFDKPLTDMAAIMADRVNIGDIKTAPEDVPQSNAALR